MDLGNIINLTKQLDIIGFLIFPFISIAVLTKYNKYDKRCDDNCIKKDCLDDLYGGPCTCFNNNYTSYCQNEYYQYYNGFNEYQVLSYTFILSFLLLHFFEIIGICCIFNKKKFIIYKKIFYFFSLQTITYFLLLIVIFLTYFNIDKSKFKYENTCPKNCFFDENDKNLCSCYNNSINTFTFFEHEEKITQIYKDYEIKFIIFVSYPLLMILINVVLIFYYIKIEKNTF